MTLTTIFAWLASFLLAAAAAYVDISSFFRQRRIGVGSVFRQPSALMFVVCNGFVSVLLLYWALTDSELFINRLFTSDNPVLKGIVIGLSVPLLIRSKWFSVAKTDGNQPAGFEAIYEWIRLNVLQNVNTWSIRIRVKISQKFAKILVEKQNVSEQLRDIVDQEITPFENQDRKIEILDGYDRIQSKYADEEEKLKQLLRYALDYCGIAPIRKHLKDLAADC